jgi:hypothetical protein
MYVLCICASTSQLTGHHFEIKIYVEVGSGLVTGFAIEEN